MDSLIVTPEELDKFLGVVTFIRSTPLPDGTYEVEFEDEDLEKAKEVLSR